LGFKSKIGPKRAGLLHDIGKGANTRGLRLETPRNSWYAMGGKNLERKPDICNAIGCSP